MKTNAPDSPNMKAGEAANLLHKLERFYWKEGDIAKSDTMANWAKEPKKLADSRMVQGNTDSCLAKTKPKLEGPEG